MLFKICSYGNLTIQEFSFKWVKVMLLYKVGGGLPLVGGGGSVMTHTPFRTKVFCRCCNNELEGVIRLLVRVVGVDLCLRR